MNIEIAKSYYNELLAAKKELDALHAGGVDNWEWYSESLRDAGLFDDEEEDEDESTG
jgi:hypothetical protein